MGCLYMDLESKCTLSLNDDGVVDSENLMRGCAADGYCNVCEDPDPADNCEAYESDWVCSKCGEDLNVDDCGCYNDE